MKLQNLLVVLPIINFINASANCNFFDILNFAKKSCDATNANDCAAKNCCYQTPLFGQARCIQKWGVSYPKKTSPATTIVFPTKTATETTVQPTTTTTSVKPTTTTTTTTTTTSVKPTTTTTVKPTTTTTTTVSPTATVLPINNLYSDAQFNQKFVGCPPINAQTLRAAFHDAGSFNPSSRTGNLGGIDGSILFELNRPENRGLEVVTNFIMPFTSKHNVSLADALVAAANIALTNCGGPALPRTFGRVDVKKANDPNILPSPRFNADQMIQVGTKFGMNVCETVATFTGSHSIGMVRDQGNVAPGRTTGPLDTTNAQFDNRIFSVIRNGGDVKLQSDSAWLVNFQGSQCIDLFIRDQRQFFSMYVNAMMRIMQVGQRNVKVALA